MLVYCSNNIFINMKILISEAQLFGNNDLLKQICFKYWDKKGFATSDKSFLQLFKIPGQMVMRVEALVDEWNESHNITPISILEKDFGPFYNSTVSKHIYTWPNRRGGYTDIEVSNSDFSCKVRIHSMDFNLNDRTLDVWFEMITSELRDRSWNGRTFNEVYPYGYNNDEFAGDDIDEDEYWEIYDEYKGEVAWLLHKYFMKNYVSKMGEFKLEIEHY